MQVSKFKVISIIGISVLLSSLLVADKPKTINKNVNKPAVLTQSLDISKMKDATLLDMPDENNHKQGSKAKTTKTVVEPSPKKDVTSKDKPVTTTQSVVESSNNAQIKIIKEPIANAQNQISAIPTEKTQVMNVDAMANQSVVVKNPIDELIKSKNITEIKKIVDGNKISPDEAYNLGLKAINMGIKDYKVVDEDSMEIANILMTHALKGKNKVSAIQTIDSLELYKYASF